MEPVPLARRSFLCLAAGAAVAPLLGAAQTKLSTPAAEALGWRLSVQMFSYRRFPLFEALDHLAALGVRHLEPRTGLKVDARRPDLKFSEDLPPDVRKEFKSRLADRGLSMTSCFLDFTADDPAQPRRVFEFCKELGATTVVAEPPAAVLDAIENLCDEYRMNLAIHNHQEGQSRYWSPDLLLAACRGRGPRVGGCCDLGQWARSGLDPVECLRKVQGRILAIHLKDVGRKGDRNSRNVVFGTGEATLPAALRELRRQNYQGLTTIDYEQDSPAIDEDMAGNAAFVEGVARDLR
jgi:sugar phosphate isomerase/epimerase